MVRKPWISTSPDRGSGREAKRERRDSKRASAERSFRQGHRIKIGELGRMADPAFGENLSVCGTSSHLFTMFAVALVIINKYDLYVQ